MAELRWHPLIKDWVMIASQRQERPQMPKDWCPFCPGSGRVPDHFDVFEYDNDFPTLSQAPPEPDNVGTEFFRVRPSYGKCEVILYSQEHNITLAELPVGHICKLVDLWVERFNAMKQDEKIKYIFIFENRRDVVGVTMPHPHGQIYGYSVMPKKLQLELEACREYYEGKGSCLLCDMIREEQAFKKRIVFENKHFTCFLPFFTEYPYGVYIMSKAHKGDISEFDDAQKDELAEMLKETVGMLDSLFGYRFPYMMCMHNAPVNSQDSSEYYHFHVEFFPPMRSAEKQKFNASSETGAWAHCNPTCPEEKAEELRQAHRKYLPILMEDKLKMETIEQLINLIHAGGMDKQFKLLYGKDDQHFNFQKNRYLEAIHEFGTLFSSSSDRKSEIRLLSVPGRSEIGGNHTDHNHGRVMACAVDLDIIAVVRKNDSGIIRIKSEGFDMDTVEISDVMPNACDRYRSTGLIKGVLAGLAEFGYDTGSGFDAYTTSSVLKGSGLSSSAAFEVMVANIISHLYNNGKIAPVVLAQVSQYAESEFFGKPCGLMDQLACAVGGFITIDFTDTSHPVIEKLDFDFASTDCMLCIVDTAGTHSDLNEDYASIQAEMKHVAGLMGHKYLRECEETEFYRNIGFLRDKAGDRELLRAIHFFGENARVPKQAQALKAGDFERFKNLVIESGRSSFMYLQNSYSTKEPSMQGISLGLALAQRVLEGSGAWRVHGGGFAGTIQAFVPYDKADGFISDMNKVFGKSSCYCLNVRNIGACCLL